MSINLECYTLVTKGELVPNELIAGDMNWY